MPYSSNLSNVETKPEYPLSMQWLFAVVNMSIPISFISYANSAGELNVGYPEYPLSSPAKVVSKFPTATVALSIYFVTFLNIGEKSYVPVSLLYASLKFWL